MRSATFTVYGDTWGSLEDAAHRQAKALLGGHDYALQLTAAPAVRGDDGTVLFMAGPSLH